MTMTGKSAVALALAVILLSGAQAQVKTNTPGEASNNPAGEKELPLVKLTLTPAAEPVPALRHKLLPDQWEQTPGNAAPYYYRALMLHASVPENVRKQLAENWDEQKWEGSPLEKLPKKEIRDLLGSFKGALGELETAAHRERCDWEWRQVWGRAVRELGQYSDWGWGSGLRDWAAQGAAAALMMKAYPNAKRELIAGGYSSEQVEAMPVGQVMAIQSARNYRYVADEMAKWSLLPYPQARERMKQAEERLMKEGYFGRPAFDREVFPVASVFLPALNQAAYAGVRFQREIAALRTIEAIRMHAAGNDGRLPESLERITVVPAASDPLTGKPFPYRLEGQKALLDVPFPPEKTDKRDGRRYEIVIVPLKSEAGK